MSVFLDYQEEIRVYRKKCYDLWESLSKKEIAEFRELDPEKAKDVECQWRAYRGLEDFWVFLTEVIQNPVLYEPLHRPLAVWCTKWEKSDSKLLLMARGHVKSNIFTVEHTVWEIARNPNLRVGVASHKQPDAQKFLMGIANYIYRNKRFQAHYPEIKPMPGVTGRPFRWSKDYLLVDRKSDYLEATVEALAPGADVTGRHYEMLKEDDLVTNENKKTPGPVHDFHELCESLLVGKGRRALIGTRYAYDDLYGTILDTAEKFETYDVYIMSAFKVRGIMNEYLAGRYWRQGDDEKYLVYPTHFTLRSKTFSPGPGLPEKKSLVAVRKRQGSTVFANQYELEPFDPTDAVFSEEDIKIVGSLPELPKGDNYRYYRHCDMSSETHTGESYTAIVSTAVDQRCNIFVTDIFWGDKRPKEIVEELIRGQKIDPTRRPLYVSMEPGPYERAVKPWLEERMAQEGVYVNVYMISGAMHMQKKADHIKGLQPWVEAGKFHILESCPHKDLLIEEMVKFPAFSRTDIVDATAQCPAVALPSNYEEFFEDSGYGQKGADGCIVPRDEAGPRYGVGEETGDDVFRKILAKTHKTIGNDRVMRGGVVRMGRFR